MIAYVLGGKKYVRWLPVYVAHVLTCILPAVFEIVYGNHYEGNEYKSMVAALLPKLYDALCVAFLRVYYIRYDILGSERVADWGVVGMKEMNMNEEWIKDWFIVFAFALKCSD